MSYPAGMRAREASGKDRDGRLAAEGWDRAGGASRLSRKDFLKVLGAGTALAAGVLPPRSTQAEPKTFGLVAGSDRDTPGLLAALQANGFTHRTVHAQWSRLQASARGPLDAAQLSDLTSRIQAVRDAGLRVDLRINLHHPPGFVKGGPAPAPSFRAQDGTLWSLPNTGSDVRDWIWSRRGRDYAADFVRKVLTALDLAWIDRVQLGGGIRGELQFPLVGRRPPYKFWCYAGHAQFGGPDLAAGVQSATQAGLPPNYVPFGPGSTAENDEKFRSWYVGSLTTMMIWLIGEHRKAGWDGPIFVLHPSVGLRSNTTPDDWSYQEAIAQGQDWDRHIRWYAANDPGVWPWSTWIDRDQLVSPVVVDSDLSPARKLYNVAKAHGRADRISGETAGVTTGDELDRVLGPSGPVATGYTSYSQLDLAEWGVPGAPTIAQLGQRIGRYRCP